jgi:MFS family permease
MAGGGAMVLALVPFGRLADRVGYRGVLTVGFALAATMLLVLISRHGLRQALPPIMLLGLAYAMILPAWNGLLTSSAPHERRGSLMGFFMTVEGAGFALGPPLGGALATMLGSSTWPFYGAALMLAAMTVLYALLPLQRFRLDEVRS